MDPKGGAGGSQAGNEVPTKQAGGWRRCWTKRLIRTKAKEGPPEQRLGEPQPRSLELVDLRLPLCPLTRSGPAPSAV